MAFKLALDWGQPTVSINLTSWKFVSKHERNRFQKKTYKKCSLKLGSSLTTRKWLYNSFLHLFCHLKTQLLVPQLLGI